ncbi:hypothetical protein LOK49_LG09G01669 [Camellia lanceoleosa]|uniref:Uncharacterized protein n=1 Tax=Camellia lanceoleosa TaxID=1840588 RepID=A0ACC0GJM6_9ERIC|nr:hypothetical protein LOK49_LG09G01669 [Camellia lanceoleosa]
MRGAQVLWVVVICGDVQPWCSAMRLQRSLFSRGVVLVMSRCRAAWGPEGELASPAMEMSSHGVVTVWAWSAADGGGVQRSWWQRGLYSHGVRQRCSGDASVMRWRLRGLYSHYNIRL